MTEIKKDILWRVRLVFLVILLFSGSIFYKIIHIQYVEGDELRKKADNLTLKYFDLEANRGNIFTSDGSLLSTSVPVYDLRVDFKAKGFNGDHSGIKIDVLAAQLANLFNDRSKAEYRSILSQGRKRGDRYYLLKSKVTYRQMKAAQQLSIFELGRFKGGLIVEQFSKREKPFRMLAARTIGHTTDHGKPIGIEGAFNKYLQGQSGKCLMQKISGGVWKPVNDEFRLDAQNGYDVVTTIDLNIQDVAQHSLRNQLQMHDCSKGTAILMEVKTGEIKAIANLTRNSQGEYVEDFNYSIGYGTEMGSTFKLLSYMALLEDGYVDLEDSIDTQGGVAYFSGVPIKDSHEGGYGVITIKRAFELSSNVAISKLIKKYYAKEPQRFLDHIKSVKIDQPLGLQINGEAQPRIKEVKDKDWSKVSLPFMSIGYESILAPIHILSLYNAVANNGVMVKPMFVKSINDNGKEIVRYKTEVLNPSIASPATIKKMQSMLEGVVEQGTASNLKHTNYKTAGKTGTAIMAKGGKGYQIDGKKYQASFVGYFPAHNPQYTCMVIVYDLSPRFYYGNVVAGPVFKDIADKVYSTRPDLHPSIQNDTLLPVYTYPLVKSGNGKRLIEVADVLGLSLNNKAGEYNWVKANAGNQGVNLLAIKESDDVVPDVRGMGLRDAIYLLERQGMFVHVMGSGQVKTQSIVPGSKSKKGQPIYIVLN
ncbi:MAG TPA: penicillin-binding protein [Bacteroidia bacterium]|nr:penicillin-binding protein [Bacteroidia bacterium]